MNIHRHRIPLYFFLFAVTCMMLVCAGTVLCNRNDACSEDHRLLSVLWHTRSGEYRALAYQAYNTARMVLDASGETGSGKAVIIDIDDTVIDTSRYQAYLVLKRKYFPFEWDSRCCDGSAMAVPGSREFLDYASARGYAIFYISNRSIDLLERTLAEMQRFGFPQSTREHVLLKDSGRSKQHRRDRVLRDYKVKLLIGDNIEDFSHVFESKNNTQRKELVDSMSSDFGTRFIILPNVMYGSWLNQIMGQSDMSGISKRGSHMSDALKKQ